jgi:hypothetical protein
MKQGLTSLSPYLLAAGMLLLAGACTRDDTPPPPADVPAKAIPPAASPPPVSTDGLKLLDLRIVKAATGKLVLKGNVSNSSATKITLATATFALLDKKGREIGTAVATVDNLEANFAWTFEVPILQEGVASAKFAGFTAK